MSDLLIKNMEMPKRCTGCFNSKCLLFFEHTDPNNSRHPNCPLVEVEPHGDLIDRDKLLRLDNITYIDTGHWMSDYEAVKTSVIENAPTVLEASE